MRKEVSMLIGYARVSTQDQSLDLQTDALLKAGCEKIFTEKASGAQRDRPELANALNVARAGDTLIVWKLDRLARSTKQLIDTIENLKERSIHFKSLQEGIDTSSPMGHFIFVIMSGLAQFEKSLILERTMAGLRAARDRGRLGGRPKLVSEEDLAKARALLRDPTITIKEAAKTLNISEPTLYRYMKGGREAFVSGKD